MQPYDIFMLIVLVGAAVFGAWKGVAWQLASIASVLVSAMVAMRFSSLLAPSLSAEEPWNQFLAMGILFAGTSLGVWIAFRFVAKVIDRVKLKEFDRQMGALLGAAKGVLYCLILTFFAVTLSEGTRQRVLDSRSGYYAAVLVQKGTPLMPEKARLALGKYIQKLDQGLTPRPPAATPGENSEDPGNPALTSAMAELGLPLAPLTLPDQTQPIAGQPAAPPAPAWQLDAWKQGAQDVVNQHADQLGRQAGAALEQHADQLGSQLGAALNQQATELQRQAGAAIDQVGRQISTTVDQNYNQYRTSAEQAAQEVRSQINRGFDAFGRRIQQAPMKPIQ